MAQPPPSMQEELAYQAESERKQYKRDMMLQLVRNEALTETIKHLPEGNEFHKVIATMADKLTEEAFK